MRKRELPLIYEYQHLMDELNELCINVKMNRPIDFAHLDKLQVLINAALREINKPYKLH